MLQKQNKQLVTQQNVGLTKTSGSLIGRFNTIDLTFCPDNLDCSSDLTPERVSLKEHIYNAIHINYKITDQEPLENIDYIMESAHVRLHTNKYVNTVFIL